MRNRSLLFAWLLLFGLGAGATALQSVNQPTSQSAGPPTTAGFTGLDVIILIDQSGSMWGFPRQTCGAQKIPCATRNDAYNHRIGQTKNVLYRLAEHVENTAFVHRVSVVDFGSEAAVALSNYAIRFTANDPGGALRDIKAVTARAITAKDGVPPGTGTGKGVNTDTPRALELALSEYQKMAATPPTAGRERVMLIITDGAPHNPDHADNATLRQQTTNLAGQLKSQSVGLWVVGLNDASNYWNDGDGAFWEGLTGQGQARLAETAQSKISVLMQDITDEWLGAHSNLMANDQYQCPPYLRRIVFSVNFGKPGVSPQITDPNGTQVPLASGGAATAPGTFARFIAEDPKPGLYKLARDPSRSYTTSVEEYSADVKRLSPINAVSHEVETRLVFQATDSQGNPLMPLPAWPIAAAVAVTPPGGTAVKIPAQYLDDGKWLARWKPPQPGIYTVRLEGMIKLPTGKSYDVFGANAKSYNDKLEVNRLHPYFLRLDEPSPAGGFRVMPRAKEAPLSFTLVDAKGAVAAPAGLIKDPATWLSLQLIDKAGNPLNGTAIPLKPVAAGAFEAAVPISLEGWLVGWWEAGQLRLRVTPQPNRVNGDNYLDSIQLPPEAEALRVGGDPLTAGPLKVRYSWLVLGSALLLLLGVVVALFLYFWYGLLPKLAFWTVDARRGRLITVKIYDGDEDPLGDSAKKFPAGRGHKFNYDRQVSLTVEGETLVASKFRIQRLWGSDVRVLIEYAWQNDPAKKTYQARVSKMRPERVKGPDGAAALGGYLFSLEVK